MNTIQVGHSIGRGYGLLFGRIATVAGLSWVGALLFAGLRYGLLKAAAGAQPSGADPLFALLMLAGFMAVVLIVSAIAVPLTRAAMGAQEDWVIAHFVLGARELRMAWALIRLAGILIVLAALGGGLMAGVGLGAHAALAQWPALAASGVPVAAIATLLAGALAVVAFLYVGLRLSFLLYPVAAMEPRASLIRVWQLAGGHVLRIAAVTAAIELPVLALGAVALFAVIGGPLIDTLQALNAGHAIKVTALLGVVSGQAGPIALLSALFVTVVLALVAGASAAAYRQIAGLGPEAAAADVPEAKPHIEPAPSFVAGEAPADHDSDVQDHDAAEPVPVDTVAEDEPMVTTDEGHDDGDVPADAAAQDASHDEEAHAAVMDMEEEDVAPTPDADGEPARDHDAPADEHHAPMDDHTPDHDDPAPRPLEHA